MQLSHDVPGDSGCLLVPSASWVRHPPHTCHLLLRDGTVATFLGLMIAGRKMNGGEMPFFKA